MSDRCVVTCQRADGLSAAMPSQPELASVRVLLVEDDDVDAKLIRLHAGAMEGLRLVIERAVSTAEARKLLSEHSFDLCILDFWLGCESSLRFLADLDGRIASLPVVVLTSLSTPDIRQMCEQAGATCFVGKDKLNASSLSSAVSAALRPPEPHLGAHSHASLVKLLTNLPDVMETLQGRGRLSLAAADEFHERALLRDRLAVLIEMTETVRFGVFEQVQAARLHRTTQSSGAWTPNVGSVIAGAIETARGVLDGRGQTIAFRAPDPAIGIACDPATFFFLMFELVERASHQSASDSRIRAEFRAGAQSVSIAFDCETPSDANAGDVALGPLFGQLLSANGAHVTNTVSAHGGLLLKAQFAAKPRPSVGGTSLH